MTGLRRETNSTTHTFTHLLHDAFTTRRCTRSREIESELFTIFECNWFICCVSIKSFLTDVDVQNFVHKLLSPTLPMQLMHRTRLDFMYVLYIFLHVFLPLFIVATTIKVKLNQ